MQTNKKHSTFFLFLLITFYFSRLIAGIMTEELNRYKNTHMKYMTQIYGLDKQIFQEKNKIEILKEEVQNAWFLKRILLGFKIPTLELQAKKTIKKIQEQKEDITTKITQLTQSQKKTHVASLQGQLLEHELNLVKKMIETISKLPQNNLSKKQFSLLTTKQQQLQEALKFDLVSAHSKIIEKPTKKETKKTTNQDSEKNRQKVLRKLIYLEGTLKNESLRNIFLEKQLSQRLQKIGTLTENLEHLKELAK